MTNEIELWTVESLCTEYTFLDAIRRGDLIPADSTVATIVRAIGTQESARRPDMSPPHLFWRAFVTEFKIYLCTNDKKYASLRRPISLYGKNQNAIISAISAGIGAYIGAASVVLVPLVVLGAVLVIKLGAEALCRMGDVDSYRPFSE